MITDDWRGLYNEGWKNKIVPEAISHPAKFSRSLIEHIYQHAIEQGWLKAGSKVIDPFAGVALGALDAMRYGMHWTGVELEKKFVDLGSKNITLWNDNYYFHFDNWGKARILQGDSRHLLQVIRNADAAISSPPYAETRIDGKGDEGSSGLRNEDGSFLRGSEGWQKRKEMGERYGETKGNLGNLKDDGFDAAISSPPFIAQSGGTNVTNKEGPLSDERLLKRHAAGNAATEAYGDDPANLGNLKPEGYDAAIASPPFSESNPDGGWQLLGKYAEEGRLTVKQVGGDPNKSYPSWSKDRETPYAMSPDNLGNMQDQGFDAAVSSPPYAETEVAADLKSGTDVEERKKKRAEGEWEGYNKENPANLGSLKAEGFDASVSSPPMCDSTAGRGQDELTQSKGMGQDYDDRLPFDKRGFLMGDDEYQKWSQSCNLGSFRSPTETFWSAARTIIDQTYAALKPGGVAIWVTKSFVKDGKRVDFPGQWQRMCEAAGFVTLHRHKAWLVEDRGSQFDMFGELHEKKVERKSFFRRLAEKKGSPRIDYEVVTCMMKPKGVEHAEST